MSPPGYGQEPDAGAALTAAGLAVVPQSASGRVDVFWVEPPQAGSTAPAAIAALIANRSRVVLMAISAIVS
jgi:hypothetical protein